MTTASTLTSAALIAWTLAAFALARHAENGTARSKPTASLPAIASAAALGAIAIATRSTLDAAATGVASIALVAAAGPDARTGFLFDAITLPAATLVLALAIASDRTAAAAGGIAVLVIPFGTVVVASRGRSMGLGDVKAMYVIGAAFGPLESILALFVASLSGCCAIALDHRARRGAEVRFGPHLAIGTAFTLVAGDPIARSMGF